MRHPIAQTEFVCPRYTFFRCVLCSFLIATVFAAAPYKSNAAEIEYIYLRNNGISPADIWVNDSYQGWIPAGETRLVDRKGFETWGSARPQTDGTLSKREHSHGGWSGSGDSIVLICQVRNGRAFQSIVKLPKDWGVEVGSDPNEYPKVWFGENSAGEAFEVTGNEKPIEAGKEGNDCGSGALEGQAKTNVIARKVQVPPIGWRCFYAGTLHRTANPGTDCGDPSLGGLWEWVDGFKSPRPFREMPESQAKRNNLPYFLLQR